MIPWPALPPPPPTGMGHDDAAVVVSIEDYAFLPDLPGAHDNGRDWAGWLRDTQQVPFVRTLQDAEATRETVLQALEEAQQRRTGDGVVWVVFVGHGAPGGRLLGADAQPSAASITHRGLGLDELPQGPTVGVIDACFTGDLVPGLQPAVPTWATRPPPVPAAPSAPRRKRPSPHTLLLAAGPSQYAGPLPAVDRPAFSYLVLGALRGWGDSDHDGHVTATEAVAYADRMLFEHVTDRVQTPELRGADRQLSQGSEPAPRAAVVPPPPPVREAPAPPTVPVPSAPPRAVASRRPAPRLKLRWPRRSPEVHPTQASPGLLAAVAACAAGLLTLGLRTRS